MTEPITTRAKKTHKGLRVLLGILVVLTLAFLLYFENYYHAGESAEALIDSDKGSVLMESGSGSETASAGVIITESDNGWLFDGPGEDTLIILYPGAKVEASAYASLLEKLAAGGADSYLVRMPFRFAFFGMGKAGDITEEYDYDKYYLAGHSLGGVAASSYASDHADVIDGVILLASYPTDDISDLDVLSVYGDKDTVLNKDAYEESKDLWPKDSEEVVISGGNHAGIADYGPQKGDGKADVTKEEQQDATVKAILTFLEIL